MATSGAGAAFDDDVPPPPRSRWQRLRPWLFGTIAVLIGIFIALIAWLTLTAPLGRALEPLKTPSLILTDSDGKPIARRGDYKEAPVEIARLPAHVPQALIAIEDRRFYEHWGIDPRGIVRAMFRNAQAGGVQQGGSTITQQLAKTSFLSAERSIKRKLQEIIIAFWLESRLTKDEILQRYLSSVYFGDGAYGIRAAARTYFDKTPETLSLGEAAMLAGLVQAPSRLAPSRHLDDARARARVVLDQMVETGVITRVQAARTVPASYTPGRRQLPSGSYFADWVLPMARDSVDADYGDITVTTTLDRKLQNLAEAAVKDTLARSRGLDIGQAALVAMRMDGTVVAMVGGTDYKASSFNRATQAQRQPGSSWKLFVYLAALESGMRPGDTVEDSPIVIGDYEPKNDDNRYRGPTSLATAFAASSNVAAVRLAQQLGTQKVIDQARRLGIGGKISTWPAMALGTSPVTLLDMTAAYAAVASGVRPVEPTGLRHGQPGLLKTVRNTVGALTPWPARAPMLELLQSAVRNGTGLEARLPIPSYGKTGTTQNHRDALFIGFAGDLVVGVWVGNDDNSPMNGAVVGGSVPAKLWHRFMLAALEQEGLLKGVVLDDAPAAEIIMPDISMDAIGDLISQAGDAAASAVDEAAAVAEEAGAAAEPPPEPPAGEPR